MFLRIPTMITGQLRNRVRHKSYLSGANITDQIQKVICRIALYVELSSNNLFKVIHIVATDMTLIRTGMYCYALSTKALAVNSKPDKIGHIATTRVTKSGYFIDIYAQTSH